MLLSVVITVIVSFSIVATPYEGDEGEDALTHRKSTPTCCLVFKRGIILVEYNIFDTVK